MTRAIVCTLKGLVGNDSNVDDMGGFLDSVKQHLKDVDKAMKETLESFVQECNDEENCLLEQYGMIVVKPIRLSWCCCLKPKAELPTDPREIEILERVERIASDRKAASTMLTDRIHEWRDCDPIEMGSTIFKFKFLKGAGTMTSAGTSSAKMDHVAWVKIWARRGKEL